MARLASQIATVWLFMAQWIYVRNSQVQRSPEQQRTRIATLHEELESLLRLMTE